MNPSDRKHFSLLDDLLRRAGFEISAQEIIRKTKIYFRPSLDEYSARVISISPVADRQDVFRLFFECDVYHRGRYIVGLEFHPDDPDQPSYALYREPASASLEPKRKTRS